MNIHRYEEVNHEYSDDIVDILLELDEDSREDEKTSDMARDLFIDSEKEVTDREALQVYYEELADESIVAVHDQKEEVMGFTLVKENDDFFANGAGNYFPHLAVTQSATRPRYQRKGVWSKLRDYVEEEVVPDYDVNYIVSAVSEENEASQSANESKDMRKVASLNYDEDEETFVYAKQID